MIKEFETFAESVLSHEWVFAKTMPNNPHFYSLKKKWDDPAEFERCVMFIREHGYEVRYGGRPYLCFDLNGQKYWTMGAPLEDTILINRAAVVHSHPYDGIAAEYHGLFKDEESIQEDKSVMRFVNHKAGQSVLDIGCGDGLFLHYEKPSEYVGIDPSSNMLDYILESHGGFIGDSHALVCTKFERFYCGVGFDLIISLFGSFGYVHPDHLHRIPEMLNDGGRACIMVYADDYYPVTHKKTGIEIPFYTLKDYDLSAGWMDNKFTNYIVLEYEK